MIFIAEYIFYSYHQANKFSARGRVLFYSLIKRSRAAQCLFGINFYEGIEPRVFFYFIEVMLNKLYTSEFTMNQLIT